MNVKKLKTDYTDKYSDKQLQSKAEIYCSSAERCPSDVEVKLIGWGGTPETVASVMSHLFKEKYLDTIRFSSAFVRDKYRFNQWGRMKIAQALRMKGLTAEEIEAGLECIDEEEYNRILYSLLKQKIKTVKGATDYERNTKIIRFAAGRGFTMPEIMKQIKQLGNTDIDETDVFEF